MKILIIGCGLAGLSAAINASEKGCDVTVISVFPPERAQSVLAEGGINAALNTKGEDDSPGQHCEDTMKAGVFLADEKAVEGLTEHAPGLIRKLAEEGVVFNRDENGDPDMRYFGGQNKKRTVFAKAGIGKQLVAGLSAVMRRYEAEGKIKVLTDVKFVKCILSKGRYAGIIAENVITGELSYMESDSLIVASGGPGALFGNNTGSKASDGSASASLFRSGIQMANLEMIQFHPTTIATEQKRMLISEAARGEGGRLFAVRHGERWYFMEDWYGKNGNLMPRDIVSQCIYKVCHDDTNGVEDHDNAWLDLTFLDEYTVHEKLAEITDTTVKYLGIDPFKEPIPVYPGIHYFMGGIYTDREHRTSIPGIYAAGECACIYHGANRLGGNSTLGAIYGGSVAAASAADGSGLIQLTSEEKSAAGQLAEHDISVLYDKCLTENKTDGTSRRLLEHLQTIMNRYLGIVREETELKKGLLELEALKNFSPLYQKGHICDAYAADNLRTLGEAFIQSAIERRESRGAQMRSDYPERNDAEFRKTTVAEYLGDKVRIHFEETGKIFNENRD